MSQNTDHDRCSELLGPHARGELAPSDTAWVERHLASCPECTAEAAGVAALIAEPDSPLSELERARLHRSLVPEEDLASAPASTGPRQPATWYRVLTAAAVLAVIGGFAYLGLGETGQDEAGAPGGAEVSSEDGDAVDAEGGVVAGGQAGPSPTFQASLGEVDEATLNKLGREGLPLVVFSRAYDTSSVEALRRPFVDELAAQAEAVDARGATNLSAPAQGPLSEDEAASAEGSTSSGGVSGSGGASGAGGSDEDAQENRAKANDAFRDCSALVTDQFPSALPAYAAYGLFKLDGRKVPVLIIGFAWSEKGSGPLDRSMVWAWPIGNCDHPLHYSKNVIQPRG